MRNPSRVALVVAAVGAVAFAGLALALVPWHPVPGGIPSPAPPLSVFTTIQTERAEDYAFWARAWSWASLAVSLVAVCALGFSGRGRRLVERLPGRWWVRVVLAVVLVELAVRVVTLPFAALLHRHAIDYGLSHQRWPAFATDLAKGEAVTIVVASMAMLLLVGLGRRFPGAWPALAAGVLAPLVLVGSFAYPVLVEPLFNQFTPLPAGSLRTAILDLAAREHVAVDDVLVADASRRTTTLNAYVSGFGSTRRVVLYDNLVHDVPRDEVLSIVGHELAHARHDDVLTGSLLGAAGTALGVGLLGILVGAGGRRRRAIGDPAVVPLVLAIFAVGSLLTSPLENAISRAIETRADVDALRATGDPQAFIAVQRQLALHSLADPTPPALTQFWFGSHPTALTRIAIARKLESSP